MSIEIDGVQRRLLDTARRATLATIAPDGRPRLVPCCFALVMEPTGSAIYTPIDDKPKRSGDPRSLARVRDVERDPRVTLMVDYWDEDWGRLAWVRVDGVARLIWPGEAPGERDLAASSLRDRYPQYRTHALESLPLIRVTPTNVVGWAARPTD